MSDEAKMREGFEKAAPELGMALWMSRDGSNYGDYRTQIGWATWQAAISSLPRMTEEDICRVIRANVLAIQDNATGYSLRYVDDAARALITHLPHIVKEGL